jgi:hypothetical protein
MAGVKHLPLDFVARRYRVSSSVDECIVSVAIFSPHA